MLPLESVPNVSEGRDPSVVAAIADAFSSAGARVLDTHLDGDHHRAVVTLVGDDHALEQGSGGRHRRGAPPDRPAHPRRRPPARGGRGRGAGRPPRRRRPLALRRGGARGRPPGRRGGRAAGVPLRRRRRRTPARLLPARRAGGAPAADRHGRARARLWPTADRRARGGGARRGATAAPRVQHRTARDARDGSRGRAGGARVVRRAAGRAGARAPALERRGTDLDERDRPRRDGPTRDGRADRHRGGRAWRGRGARRARGARSGGERGAGSTCGRCAVAAGRSRCSDAPLRSRRRRTRSTSTTSRPTACWSGTSRG